MTDVPAASPLCSPTAIAAEDSALPAASSLAAAAAFSAPMATAEAPMASAVTNSSSEAVSTLPLALPFALPVAPRLQSSTMAGRKHARDLEDAPFAVKQEDASCQSFAGGVGVSASAASLAQVVPISPAIPASTPMAAGSVLLPKLEAYDGSNGGVGGSGSMSGLVPMYDTSGMPFASQGGYDETGHYSFMNGANGMSGGIDFDESGEDRTGGGSCHQCKTARSRSQLLICTRMGDRCRKRRCRKKFCQACLQRSYGVNALTMKAEEVDAWVCPACCNTCICAACGRRQQVKQIDSLHSRFANSMVGSSPSSAGSSVLDSSPNSAMLLASQGHMFAAGAGAGMLPMQPWMGAGSMMLPSPWGAPATPMSGPLLSPLHSPPNSLGGRAFSAAAAAAVPGSAGASAGGNSSAMFANMTNMHMMSLQQQQQQYMQMGSLTPQQQQSLMMPPQLSLQQQLPVSSTSPLSSTPPPIPVATTTPLNASAASGSTPAGSFHLYRPATAAPAAAATAATASVPMTPPTVALSAGGAAAAPMLLASLPMQPSFGARGGMSGRLASAPAAVSTGQGGAGGMPHLHPSTMAAAAAAYASSGNLQHVYKMQKVSHVSSSGTSASSSSAHSRTGSEGGGFLFPTAGPAAVPATAFANSDAADALAFMASTSATATRSSSPPASAAASSVGGAGASPASSAKRTSLSSSAVSFSPFVPRGGLSVATSLLSSPALSASSAVSSAAHTPAAGTGGVNSTASTVAGTPVALQQSLHLQQGSTTTTTTTAQMMPYSSLPMDSSSSVGYGAAPYAYYQQSQQMPMAWSAQSPSQAPQPLGPLALPPPVASSPPLMTKGGVLIPTAVRRALPMGGAGAAPMMMNGAGSLFGSAGIQQHQHFLYAPPLMSPATTAATGLFTPATAASAPLPPTAATLAAL